MCSREIENDGQPQGVYSVLPIEVTPVEVRVSSHTSAPSACVPLFGRIGWVEIHILATFIMLSLLCSAPTAFSAPQHALLLQRIA